MPKKTESPGKRFITPLQSREADSRNGRERPEMRYALAIPAENFLSPLARRQAMTPAEIQILLKNVQDYFDRSTRPLGEEHSGFTAQEGLFTVAGHVAHVAQTIDWFFEGAFGSEWSMDFETMDRQVRGVRSLEAAREWFAQSVEKAVEIAGSHSADEWAAPFPPNPIMGEVPRNSIISAIVDHTAHHRGALTVYQRLLGLTPPMPYMDM